ncbi:MAG: glutamate-5-semialdehyde dehydrogenase [Lentisphaeria bacterium]|nr:glutamate-5-semialdehyde dehydrogenase [Lentisphaeria bacterium]
MSAVLEAMGKKARAAAEHLAVLTDSAKKAGLKNMAAALRNNEAKIIEANQKDLENAKASGLSSAMIDRLTLDPARISGMAEGLETVAEQADPVGKILEKRIRPNGLEITKISVPFGVIGIIYEARPNVTSDASGICLKAGNAVILRGGKEAFNSNMVLAEILNGAAVEAGLPDGAVQFVPWSCREAVSLMLKMDQYIDLVIPRGGEGLIRAVVAQATMPVLKHYKGVCHLFVDKVCDIDKALDIIVNAKCQRPGVCNALETLLIHKEIAPVFAPRFAALMKDKDVTVFADEAFCKLVPGTAAATEEDYFAEYLDLKLAVRIVDDVKNAVDHINHYGSRHSDGILSQVDEDIEYFTGHVDSSTVYVNASTRFTDGGEFGMGAEIGISTDKLHARGPMGADELTSYKYIVRGTGQIR